MMIDKHLFQTKEEWDKCRKKYWKNTRYHTYYIGKPTSFPCIALKTYEPTGELGIITSIEEFVYPSDFNL